MKKSILKKIQSVLNNCGMSDIAAEEMYALVHDGDEMSSTIVELCKLNYDEQNYILFSNGVDKYTLNVFFKYIEKLLCTENICVKSLKKCHFMFNYLTIWDYWEDDSSDCMFDFEEELCDAIQYVELGKIQEAYDKLLSAYSFKVNIERIAKLLNHNHKSSR